MTDHATGTRDEWLAAREQLPARPGWRSSSSRRHPLEKLQAYRRRMGWSVPWVSSAPSDFNFDLGFSYTEEKGRETVARMDGVVPPIVEQNARASGTDIAGWIRRHDEYVGK